MLSKLWRFKRDQRGFTMVELMVVIVIIGVLSAIAIPTFTTQIDRAKIGRAVAELKSVKNLVELYKVENSQYPTTGEFEELVQGNGFIGWGATEAAVPMKDPWDRAYYYYVDGSGLTKYYLWSDGPKLGDDDGILASEDINEPLKDQDKPTDMADMAESASCSPTT